jgi:hypothetical protein
MVQDLTVDAKIMPALMGRHSHWWFMNLFVEMMYLARSTTFILTPAETLLVLNTVCTHELEIARMIELIGAPNRVIWIFLLCVLFGRHVLLQNVGWIYSLTPVTRNRLPLPILDLRLDMLLETAATQLWLMLASRYHVFSLEKNSSPSSLDKHNNIM